jgi:hypothetical protein
MDGWMEGSRSRSRVKDCLQQSISKKAGWVEGRKDGWMGGKAGLRIAYSNQKLIHQQKCMNIKFHHCNCNIFEKLTNTPTSKDYR